MYHICTIYTIQSSIQADMTRGDLSRVNELSSEIDLEKQIVPKKTFKTCHFIIEDFFNTLPHHFDCLSFAVKISQ